MEKSGDLMNPSKFNPLSILQVFDRLEVGPVRIEKRRITARYRLFYDGTEESVDLIYSYEEDVFDPNEAASQNLASMITAQVALNYGLFCRTISFCGVFDEADRNFLNDMAENTAREIYVKKFLEPNPFLVGDASALPVVKQRSYLQAALEFKEQRSGTTWWHLWPVHKERHAILSSGGKDSLLSFGLINELGYEVHPIFVNESGRHWYTALNAYRYFKDNIPHTSRVWVNSDRVFAWMLRRMPFIRKDFANIRSDEYPIRLWTVAVFLFGVMPLLRKHGIERLLIGDENDTTVRASHKGIQHYNGLYDQSLYFDTALSRYYLRKGWAVSQFSVLRPLFELTIEKILVKRYPHLQAHQVSCHAAHMKDGRVYPCGKCEKCRRIVSMLKAVDEDPRACGYTETQIQDCLKAIAKKGAHQDSVAVEHLLYVLNQKGLISAPSGKDNAFTIHPEVMKLHFDEERSTFDSIPVSLRRPLYRIFLEHTDGAVRHQDKSLVDFDILSEPAVYTAYPFEVNAQELSPEVPVSCKNQRILWGEMTWPEAEKMLKGIDIAILPVGAVEQHGPHLPLDTDSFDADYLARKVAAACSEPKPFVMPLIPYGVSYHHEDFKGTLSISNDVLARLVYEIGMSAARNKIRKLVIINGHGGNSPALNHAAQLINRDSRIFVCVDTGETSDVDIYKLVETPNDVHAGEIETSTTLAIRPHLVRMDQAAKLIPRFSSRYLDFTSKRGVAWYAHTQKISPDGVLGDPSKASAEKGEKMWLIMLAHLVGLVEELKRLSLDEIHQRRY